MIQLILFDKAQAKYLHGLVNERLKALKNDQSQLMDADMTDQISKDLTKIIKERGSLVVLKEQLNDIIY